MQTINAYEYATMIEQVVCEMNRPLLVHGGSGVGKTAIKEQVATKLKAVDADFRLGQYDSVDLRGIPSPENGMTVWNMPGTLPFMGNPLFDGFDDRYILVSLDEFDHANTAVKGVAYQLVQERRIGEHILRPNVRIVAMCNRTSDKGVSGGRAPEPLNRRFTHVEMGVSVEAWCDHITETCETPNKQGNVMGVSAAADGVAFITWKRLEALDAYDPAKPAICVGSPRTWEMALCYHGNPKLTDRIRRVAIAGSVGQYWADEFDTFIALKDKVTPISKIINDPTGIDLPSQPDLQYATVVAVSAAMNGKTMAALYTFVCRFAPEFVILAMQLSLGREEALKKKNPAYVKEMERTPQFLDFAKRFKEVFVK